MTKLHLFIILSTIILVLCEEPFGEKKELTSTIKCKSYAKDEPNYRSCTLTNICYLDGKWTFFDSDKTKKFDGLPVNVGTYDSSYKWNIDQVTFDEFLT